MLKVIKNNLFNIFFSSVVFINIFVSTTSKYSKNTFLIKIISLVFVSILILIDARKQKYNFQFFKNNMDKKNLTLFLLFLFVIPTLSLFHSSSFYFGSLKLFYVIFSTIPTVLSVFYFVITLNDERLKSFNISLILIGTFFILSAIIFKPFSFETGYSFSLFRWSSVILGRLEGIIFILVLYYFFNSKKNNIQVVLSIVLITVVFSIYITGLRSNFVILPVITIIFLVYFLIKKQLLLIHILSIVFVIIFSGLLIYLTPITDKFLEYKIKGINILSNDFGKDGSSSARIELAEQSVEMIKEKPLFGWGFGGFRIPYKNSTLYLHNYPHNILLEIWLELGIAGLMVFTFLIWKIFNKIKKNILLLSLFLYFLALSFISKDFPSQTFLWCFFVFYLMKNDCNNYVKV